jgi:DNA-directed RNA polymerase specialized sigma24 family protein
MLNRRRYRVFDLSSLQREAGLDNLPGRDRPNSAAPCENRWFSNVPDRRIGSLYTSNLLEVALTKHIAVKMSDTDDPGAPPPLTRNGYTRSERTEREIRALLHPASANLAAAFAELRDGHEGYRTTEALVFFIRRAVRAEDQQMVRRLFTILVERCQLYFRGAIRGFHDADTRMDIQQDVLAGVTRLLVQKNDKADFLESRFWLHLARRVASASKKVRDQMRTELLAADLVGADGEESLTVLDRVADHQLGADDLAILKAGLETLPEDLRELFVLRHYEGWQIDNERGTTREPGHPTLAEYYGVTPRAIHKRLAKAATLLGHFRKD